MTRLIPVIVVLAALWPHVTYAQCSDAGVCVVGSRQASTGHSIGASYTFGKSGKTDDLTVHSLQVEGDIRLLRHSTLTARLPWSRTSGPLGHTSGIGDLSILWNQTLWEATGRQLSVQAGGKFATGNANAANLPQAYQPGLGTNDLLLGISYEMDPWLFAAGYQLSRGRSNNAVTRLKRGDDLLGRIGYKLYIDDLTAGLELLAIQRLQESSVLDPTVAGGSAFIALPGSDQFQANLLATVSLPFSERFTLRTLAAVPLRSRDINVDGLTRSVTLSAGIQCSL